MRKVPDFVFYNGEDNSAEGDYKDKNLGPTIKTRVPYLFIGIH